MFDEISIEPHISLNTHSKEFEGFEDFGEKKSEKIADRALVFMIKGIKREWKQPLLYTFSSGPVKTIDLARIVKQVVKQCQDAGLKIIASVSDQGTNNQAVINYLMKSSIETNVQIGDKINFFKINEQKIIHIYDPPHLLKGIRNNLLKYKLIWKIQDKEPLSAQWSDIQKAYQLDKCSSDLRAMPKLTEGHVNPKKIRKMKVSCAAQVFSHTVASVLGLMTKIGDSGLDEEAISTSKVLSFFNKLFDSVNGRVLKPMKRNFLRCAVTEPVA
ncbi:hypothetical protein Zmor_024701 [Zophobas morio]|uniref:Transposable element P transposase n=1 Tax=Zophobas morio TaxID=2755281 RepID=A0AA38M8Y0_9CUCU|nr:hypothetical protein Zmor_024701 [Zophobas morio]